MSETKTKKRGPRGPYKSESERLKGRKLWLQDRHFAFVSAFREKHELPSDSVAVRKLLELAAATLEMLPADPKPGDRGQRIDQVVKRLAERKLT